MQHDEVIWQVINQNFCSYKVRTTTQNFCRNEYNLTGLCNRQSCPLANSRYATIREDNGILYLYTKTIERAHSPSKLWERVKLSNNYQEALKKIDEVLVYWPKFIIHKCKQRLTKMTQYLIRMRRLALKDRPKMVGIKKKLERRELRREMKAEAAARLEQSIEKELLNRLKDGTYGELYEDIVNINTRSFDKIMDEVEEDEEVEEELEEETEFVEDFSDDEDLEDLDDFSVPSDFSLSEDSDSDGEIKPKKKKKKIEIEYEKEEDKKIVATNSW
jgi:protein MAK16